jgi:quinolinate synthase
VAALKAEVGRRGGAVCTSSNAEALFRWAFGEKGHILFTPDEHLGTNTALAMGIPREAIGLWSPVAPPDPRSLVHCRVVVWQGYCYVHTTMTPEDVDTMREKHPGALVVVHPECPHEVVARADAYGSTTGIIKFVQDAPAGSTVVVGTEWHLVNRLQQQHPDKTVLPLRRVGCRTMAMTRMNHLLYVLDGLIEGTPRNVVTVDEETTYWAGLALERMLSAG